MHIKPTDPKHDVYRFKSNFLRYVTAIELKEPVKAIFETLTDGVGVDTGIAASCRVMQDQIKAITIRHTENCRKEILAYLQDESKQIFRGE
jgi:hypothetical protein